MSTSLPVLSIELHGEILNRISKLEPILRFRCVCKQWRSLIDDPDFAQSHHVESLLIEHLSTRKFYTIPLGYLNSISETTEFQPTKVHDQVINVNRRVLANPSCHDLILIAPCRPQMGTEEDWLLWNPYKDGQFGNNLIIPPYGFLPTELYIGLGYDVATDDYKVVKIVRRHNLELKTLIFSVRSGDWHMISDGFPNPQTLRGDFPKVAAFVNGALHWIVTRDSDAQGERRSNVKGWIVALDLTTETYHKLPLPPWVVPSHLYAVGGYLFLTTDSNSCKSMWILEDYGGENKWKRLLLYNCWMTPIAYMKSKGQVIVSNHSRELMWFRVKKNKPFKKVQLCQGNDFFNFYVLPASLNWRDVIGGSASDDRGSQAKTKKTNDKLKLKLKVVPKSSLEWM